MTIAKSGVAQMSPGANVGGLRGEPSPGAAAPDLEWMLVGYRSPGSDFATVGAVPAQMWQGRAHGCFK